MLYWDPNPELFRLPWVHWPIFWYGALFTLGFAFSFPLLVSLFVRYYMASAILPAKKEARQQAISLTDRLTAYMVIATIAGARLGHLLFYERPMDYLLHPMEIFQTRGLASHGAFAAILIASALFVRRIGTKSGLSWIRLLDFLVIPAALVGGFIRIGNFFNQEILGIQTSLPWGVIFGHPADGSTRVPRHPVQLYEAFFYFLVFFFLWRLSFRPAYLFSKGKLVGLFLLLVFGFRFGVEFLKLEQSRLAEASWTLTMGQMLSIPVVLIGILCLFSQRD